MTVHQRKMYVDSRFGQLHVHTAFPSSGGFDELTPVVCVHPAGTTGRVFRGLLADLGLYRSAYAPDLPGCGESEADEGPVGIADQAAALADLIDTLRLRRVDVIGCQAGSLVARPNGSAVDAVCRADAGTAIVDAVSSIVSARG